jgi:hypothetical protein
LELEVARQRAEWERAAFIGWQMLSGWTKMPSFGRYLAKLGLEQKAAGAATSGAVTQMTDEEIIAKVEAGLRHWQANPQSMRRVTIH